MDLVREERRSTCRRSIRKSRHASGRRSAHRETSWQYQWRRSWIPKTHHLLPAVRGICETGCHESRTWSLARKELDEGRASQRMHRASSGEVSAVDDRFESIVVVSWMAGASDVVVDRRLWLALLSGRQRCRREGSEFACGPISKKKVTSGTVRVWILRLDSRGPAVVFSSQTG